MNLVAWLDDSVLGNICHKTCAHECKEFFDGYYSF